MVLLSKPIILEPAFAMIITHGRFKIGLCYLIILAKKKIFWSIIHIFLKKLCLIRKRGGLAIHIFIAIYMFIGLAIVCDDYFVPALDRIADGK